VLALGVAASARADPVPASALTALESDKPRVRVAAIVAVGKSDDPNARRYLEAMLTDQEAAVRAAAAAALEKRGDTDAIAALEPLSSDKSALVQKVAKRALAALRAREANAKAAASVVQIGPVAVHVGDARDFSGRVTPAHLARFTAAMKSALANQAKLAVDAQAAPAAGYGLLLSIRSVVEAVEGATSFVQVKCELTLVKLPENALRLQSAATTGAGIEGVLDAKLKDELIGDAIDACAPELAKDFVEYAMNRTR
jgi:hypothetical protein